MDEKRWCPLLATLSSTPVSYRHGKGWTEVKEETGKEESGEKRIRRKTLTQREKEKWKRESDILRMSDNE